MDPSLCHPLLGTSGEREERKEGNGVFALFWLGRQCVNPEHRTDAQSMLLDECVH